MTECLKYKIPPSLLSNRVQHLSEYILAKGGVPRYDNHIRSQIGGFTTWENKGSAVLTKLIHFMMNQRTPHALQSTQSCPAIRGALLHRDEGHWFYKDKIHGLAERHSFQLN